MAPRVYTHKPGDILIESNTRKPGGAKNRKGPQRVEVIKAEDRDMASPGITEVIDILTNPSVQVGGRDELVQDINREFADRLEDVNIPEPYTSQQIMNSDLLELARADPNSNVNNPFINDDARKTRDAHFLPGDDKVQRAIKLISVGSTYSNLNVTESADDLNKLEIPIRLNLYTADPSSPRHNEILMRHKDPVTGEITYTGTNPDVFKFNWPPDWLKKLFGGFGNDTLDKLITLGVIAIPLILILLYVVVKIF